MPAIRTILHPTDFSENSRSAFETACALAREHQATLIVLHVMIPSPSPLLGGPLPDPMKRVEDHGAYGQLPWPQPSGPPINIEHRVAEGDAAEEVLRLLDALACDLVVMGTHGQTGLGRLLTGSVAEEVLRQAQCPVLVVKTPPGTSLRPEATSTAAPGELIDARPLGQALGTARTRTLIRTAAVEVVRLFVRAGQEIEEHTAKGELVVHCLEGRVAFTALGKTQVLEAGTLLGLPAGEPHALKGIQDASLLLTIVVSKS
jgi:nucleotide-binding universal stress UspA family protein/quercetin dioxygenase-like cupin family protein